MEEVLSAVGFLLGDEATDDDLHVPLLEAFLVILSSLLVGFHAIGHVHEQYFEPVVQVILVDDELAVFFFPSLVEDRNVCYLALDVILLN